MKLSKYLGYFFFGTAAFVIVALQWGCGEDPSLYQGETLAFENTPAINARDTTSTDLDLGADESSDFWLNYYFPWAVPFTPYPLFDYYLNPLALEVPISPISSVVEFVHPFYAYRFLDPFWSDDDGGDDDGRRHHDRDDDF